MIFSTVCPQELLFQFSNLKTTNRATDKQENWRKRRKKKEGGKKERHAFRARLELAAFRLEVYKLEFNPGGYLTDALPLR